MAKIKDMSKVYREAIETLNEMRMEDSDMIGIFFLGTQLCIGKTRIYAKLATARLRIAEMFVESPNMRYPDQYFKYRYKEGTPKYKAAEDQYKKDTIKYEEAKKVCRQKGKDLVTKLEESGMLEFRKLGDRSPKFPHNKTGIDKEQADRLSSMLDASDDEMVNLAITILKEMK